MFRKDYVGLMTGNIKQYRENTPHTKLPELLEKGSSIDLSMLIYFHKLGEEMLIDDIHEPTAHRIYNLTTRLVIDLKIKELTKQKIYRKDLPQDLKRVLSKHSIYYEASSLEKADKYFEDNPYYLIDSMYDNFPIIREWSDRENFRIMVDVIGDITLCANIILYLENNSQDIKVHNNSTVMELSHLKLDSHRAIDILEDLFIECIHSEDECLSLSKLMYLIDELQDKTPIIKIEVGELLDTLGR